MEQVILVVHLIVALAIIAVVLVQPSEAGGFLGNSGSMSNMMAPRRKGDVLTRLTAILGGIFFLTSLVLGIFAENKGPSKSILDVQTEIEKTAPAPDASALKTVAPVKAETQKETPAAAPEKNKKPAAPISK